MQNRKSQVRAFPYYSCTLRNSTSTPLCLPQNVSNRHRQFRKWRIPFCHPIKMLEKNHLDLEAYCSGLHRSASQDFQIWISAVLLSYCVMLIFIDVIHFKRMAAYTLYESNQKRTNSGTYNYRSDDLAMMAFWFFNWDCEIEWVKFAQCLRYGCSWTLWYHFQIQVHNELCDPQK